MGKPQHVRTFPGAEPNRHNPPTSFDFSNKVTSKPCCFICFRVAMPAAPPPMTATVRICLAVLFSKVEFLDNSVSSHEEHFGSNLVTGAGWSRSLHAACATARAHGVAMAKNAQRQRTHATRMRATYGRVTSTKAVGLAMSATRTPMRHTHTKTSSTRLACVVPLWERAGAGAMAKWRVVRARSESTTSRVISACTTSVTGVRRKCVTSRCVGGEHVNKERSDDQGSKRLTSSLGRTLEFGRCLVLPRNKQITSHARRARRTSTRFYLEISEERGNEEFSGNL